MVIRVMSEALDKFITINGLKIRKGYILKLQRSSNVPINDVIVVEVFLRDRYSYATLEYLDGTYYGPTLMEDNSYPHKLEIVGREMNFEEIDEEYDKFRHSVAMNLINLTDSEIETVTEAYDLDNYLAGEPTRWDELVCNALHSGKDFIRVAKVLCGYYKPTLEEFSNMFASLFEIKGDYNHTFFNESFAKELVRLFIASNKSGEQDDADVFDSIDGILTKDSNYKHFIELVHAIHQELFCEKVIIINYREVGNPVGTKLNSDQINNMNRDDRCHIFELDDGQEIYTESSARDLAYDILEKVGDIKPGQKIILSKEEK